MKKYLFCYISLLMLISILMPCKVFAVDISIGATTWYAWLEQQFSSNFIYENQKEKANPAFLYGPVLSAKFNDDFNLTFVYIFGKFDLEQEFYANIFKYKLKRKDSDLALNYRLNNYFKAFLGLKYIGFNMSIQDETVLLVHTSGGIYNVKHNSLGPGLGLSATYPVYDNIFLLATISGFCLWGKESKDIASNSYLRDIIKADSNDFGINSTLSLAYYIAPAATTISLGGRFQYIKTYYRNFPDIDSIPALSGSGADVHFFDTGTTKFYGITLTATYSFGI